MKIKHTKKEIKKSLYVRAWRFVLAARRRLNFLNPFTGSGDILTGPRDLF